MALVQRREEEFEALNTAVFLVGFENEDRTRAWLSRHGLHFPFLLDPEREVFRAYELESSFWRAFHPRNLWSYAVRFLRTGALPEIFRADPNQLGGDFLVDAEGVLRLAHYSQDPTDRPSVDALLNLLGDLHASRPPD